MSDTKAWAPVFAQNGNEFIFPLHALMGATEQDAKEIGGKLLMECIMLGITYQSRAIQVIGVEFLHIIAELPNRDGHSPVCVALFRGPLYDTALSYEMETANGVKHE